MGKNNIMANILVLGAGMVGSAMALDLAVNHSVTVADMNETALNKLKQRQAKIQTTVLDVSNSNQLSVTLRNFDLILSAVPGFLGFKTLKTIIEAEKNVVDISFFPENALELNELAKKKQVTAIVDCGVAPGLDNIILGYYDSFWEITEFECLVGGLPKIKKWPFYYKAPFSPIDVIEEYTRPARFVEQGKVVTREPLTDCEFIDFEKVGTLESFNTDGLRSLIQTMPHIPFMKEKTLRYPGHVELIKALKTTGFFDTTHIYGTNLSPLAFTSKILFQNWKLAAQEPELTVMRVRLKGKENTEKRLQEVVFNLYDEYCPKTQISSMARTTGYTATAAVNMLLNNLFPNHGVFPPELIGKSTECYHFIMNYLAERGIQMDVKIIDLE